MTLANFRWDLFLLFMVGACAFELAHDDGVVNITYNSLLFILFLHLYLKEREKFNESR